MPERPGELPEGVRRYGREIARLVRENPIVNMPSHIVLLGRVIALLSGLAKSLEVELNLMSTLLPYAIGRDHFEQTNLGEGPARR